MLTDWSFHHIGIAVHNIEESSSIYIQSGYIKSETVYDPIQNVFICFLNKEKFPCVELLAPNDENSPIYNILYKNGVAPYHFCYEVKNMDDAIFELRKQGYIVVKKPETAVAINNKKVCFLYNKNIGLIELVEK